MVSQPFLYLFCKLFLVLDSLPLIVNTHYHCPVSWLFSKESCPSWPRVGHKFSCKAGGFKAPPLRVKWCVIRYQAASLNVLNSTGQFVRGQHWGIFHHHIYMWHCDMSDFINKCENSTFIKQQVHPSCHISKYLWVNKEVIQNLFKTLRNINELK